MELFLIASQSWNLVTASRMHDWLSCHRLFGTAT